MSSLVTCQVVEQAEGVGGVVAKVEFNSPERLNALTVDLAAEFSQTVRHELKENLQNKDLRAVVLTGSGRAFSAGGDIDWLIDRHNKSQDKEANVKTMIGFYKSFLMPLRELPCPVIAAINGPAIGAGACVAVGGCDIRYASAKAKLAFNFTKIGLHPGMAGTHFLPRLIGPSKAADLLLTGRLINAQEALECGLVNKVCDDPLQDAMELALTLASTTSVSAVSETLMTLRRQQEAGLEDSMRREAEAQAITYATKDFLEGVTAVKEKRIPVFKGE